MAGVRGVPRGHRRVEGPGLSSAVLRALRRLAAAQDPVVLPAGTALKPLYANPTAVSNIDAAEDDLMTYTLPGGTLANIGDSVCVEACITWTNNAAGKTLRFYFGVLQYTAAVGGGTVGTAIFYIRIMRLDGTHQQMGITQNAGGGASANVAYVAATQTLSGTNVIKFTGQSPGGAGTITQQYMNIQLSQP